MSSSDKCLKYDHWLLSHPELQLVSLCVSSRLQVPIYQGTEMRLSISTAHRLHEKYVELLSVGADLFLLIIRLYFGYRFFRTGLGKLMNFESIVQFFSSLGIPLPTINTAMAASTELVGGILLAVGLGSRIISVPLAFTMVIAYLTAHSDALWGFAENPDLFFRQAPFPFLFATLTILFFGAGRWSIDSVIKRKSSSFTV